MAEEKTADSGLETKDSSVVADSRGSMAKDDKPNSQVTGNEELESIVDQLVERKFQSLKDRGVNANRMNIEAVQQEVEKIKSRLGRELSDEEKLAISDSIEQESRMEIVNRLDAIEGKNYDSYFEDAGLEDSVKQEIIRNATSEQDVLRGIVKALKTPRITDSAPSTGTGVPEKTEQEVLKERYNSELPMAIEMKSVPELNRRYRKMGLDV